MQEIGLRWAAQRRALERAGAPAEVVQAMEDVVLEPTGTGRVGRLVVATAADGVVLDLTLPGPPVAEESLADAVLLWGLLATDARITLLAEDERELREGIGALLRYADASTPHDTVPSISATARPAPARSRADRARKSTR